MVPETDKLNMILDDIDSASGDATRDDLSISSSSGNGTSVSKSGHDAKQDQAEKALRDKIINNEEKAVRKARIIVIGAFIACATAVSVSVYKFASKADFRSFELDVRRCLGDDTCVSVYFKTTTGSLL
jgi:hypothetical protein